MLISLQRELESFSALVLRCSLSANNSLTFVCAVIRSSFYTIDEDIVVAGLCDHLAFLDGRHATFWIEDDVCMKVRPQITKGSFTSVS